MFWLLYCYSFFISCFFYQVVCGPTTLKLVSPAKKTFFFICRWNHKEICEIRKFENAIWESNFDTMGYVWMGRWKYRKQHFSMFQQRTLLQIPQSEQADYCRNNWWQKKLSLFSTKWWNKAWAIYRHLVRYLLLKIFMQAKGYL